MKVFKFLILALAALTMFSCGEDEPTTTEKTNAEKIIGKWAYVSIQEGNNAAESHEHTSCGKDYAEFKTDKTFVNFNYQSDCTFSSSLGTYTINENAITVTENNQTISGVLTTLTESTMVITVGSNKYSYEKL